MSMSMRFQIIKKREQEQRLIQEIAAKFIREYSPIYSEKFQFSHILLPEAHCPNTFRVSYQNKSDPSKFFELEVDVRNGEVLSLDVQIRDQKPCVELDFDLPQAA